MMRVAEGGEQPPEPPERGVKDPPIQGAINGATPLASQNRNGEGGIRTCDRRITDPAVAGRCRRVCQGAHPLSVNGVLGAS